MSEHKQMSDAFSRAESKQQSALERKSRQSQVCQKVRQLPTRGCRFKVNKS